MRGLVNGSESWHGWRRAGREGWALDRVSPALRAGASDFGKTQSHQRSFPPAAVHSADILGSATGPTVRADRFSLTRLRSLDVLFYDLDLSLLLGDLRGSTIPCRL